MSQDKKLYIFFALSVIGAVIVFGTLLFFLNRHAPVLQTGNPIVTAAVTGTPPASSAGIPLIPLSHSNVGYISNRPLLQYISRQGQTAIAYVVYDFSFDIRNTGKTKEVLTPSSFTLEDNNGSIYDPTTDGSSLAVSSILLLPNTDTIIHFEYTIDKSAHSFTFVNKGLGSATIMLHTPQ